MSYEDLFYLNIFLFLKEINNLRLASPKNSNGFEVVNITLSTNDEKVKYLVKLQEWGLILLKDTQQPIDSKKVICVFEITPLYQNVYVSIEKITDHPFLAESNRIKKIQTLLESSALRRKKTLSLETEVVVYGKFTFDSKKGLLTYGRCNYIINPERIEMKLLYTLIAAKGEIVGYKQLAKTLNLNSYISSEEANYVDKDFSKEMQHYKEITKKYLSKLPGVSKNEKMCVSDVVKSIQAVTNKGYRIIQT